MTIPPTTFERFQPEDLSPPPDPTASERSDPVGKFFPHTVAPYLKNGDEIRRLLQRDYPPLLRDAGIEGTVALQIHLDSEGAVLEAVVAQSSGHSAFDQVALDLASNMTFAPALNRDKQVQVWVRIPVRFQVR